MDRLWDGGAGLWSEVNRWSPNGVPQFTDEAIIGQLNPVAGEGVVVDDDSAAEDLIIQNGMQLNTGSWSLEVHESTLVTGQVGDHRSQLRVIPYGGAVSAFDTLNMTVEDGAEFRLSSGADADVNERFFLKENSILTGNGTVHLHGIEAHGFYHDGIVRGRSAGDGLEIIQHGTGLIDLDGDLDNGLIDLTSLDDDPNPTLRIVGHELADAFSGMIRLVNGGRLNMDLTDPWTADSDSEINVQGIGIPELA